VVAFEVWNEWDIDIGGAGAGRAEDYLSLLKAVVPVLREVAPKVKVLGGSATPEQVDRGYLRELISLGLLDWVDGVSVHPYVWARPDSSAAAVMAWLRNVQAYTRGKPLYITEVGWPTHAAPTAWRGVFRSKPPGVTEANQRERMCQLVALAGSDKAIRGLFFYGLLDEGADAEAPEHRFGLLRQSGTPRPAFSINACAVSSIR
jgi:polysaccharide biosynthesis protein PslG